MCFPSKENKPKHHYDKNDGPKQENQGEENENTLGICTYSRRTWAQGGGPPPEKSQKGDPPPPKKPPIAIKISEGPPLDFLARPRMVSILQ